MCMGGSSAPKAETPSVADAPPEQPTAIDDAVKNARRQQRQMAAAAAGYASTMKTGPLGDLSSPNLAKTTLGA